MRKRLLQSTSIAAGLCGLPFLASAQEMLAANDTPESVLISASMLNKTIIDNTQAATVVTETQIKQQNFTDLIEVLRQQPGLEFKKAGAPGQFNYIKLRGLSTSILFIIDGVKVNEPSSGNMGYVIGQLDPSVVQRIEILRGPQATTYGADSTAGAIVITTKDGSLKDAHLAGEYGSLEWKKGMAGFRGNTEFGSGTLLYSVNLSKIDSGGVWQYEFSHNQTVQGRLDYSIGKFDAGVSYFNTINKFQFAELSEAFCCQTNATYWSWQTPDPHQYSGTNEIVGSAYARYRVFDSLSAKVFYGIFEKYFSQHDAADGLLGTHPAPFDNFDFNFTYFPGFMKGDPVPVFDTPSPVDSYYRDRRTQVDGTLTYDRGMVQGLLGFEYMREAAHQYGSFGDLGGKQGIYSYYGLGQFKPVGGALTLAAGVRLDDYSYSWGSAATYNLGASYRVTENVDVFVNYGTSFTAPTMYDLYSPQYGNIGTKPESGKTTEGGVRLDFLDNRLHADVTYWNSKIDDVIIFDPTIPNPRSSFGFGVYSNGPQAKTDGVEFAAFYDVMDNLKLFANYTYTDSFQQNSSGVWLTTVQIAKDKGNIGAEYTWGKLTVGANLLLNGPRLRWARDVSTPGYARLDVSARYKFLDHWSVYSRIENLLDAHIIEELGFKQPGIYGIGGIEYSFY
jgi:vitamin B12 transporter